LQRANGKFLENERFSAHPASGAGGLAKAMAFCRKNAEKIREYDEGYLYKLHPHIIMESEFGYGSVRNKQLRLSDRQTHAPQT